MEGDLAMLKKLKPYIISAAAALFAGVLSSLLSGNMGDAYSFFIKPAFAPPGVVFPIVWTALFILMGISSAMIWVSCDPGRQCAIKIYAAQLAVNFMWSILFFRFRLIFFSFLWIILLIVLVVLMIARFYEICKTSAYLQIPYLVWLVFAALLNLSIYFLNR